MLLKNLNNFLEKHWNLTTGGVMSFCAAIQNEVDTLCLGGKRFDARGRICNFSIIEPSKKIGKTAQKYIRWSCLA